MGFPSMHKTLYSVFSYKRTNKAQEDVSSVGQDISVETRMEHACCDRNTFNILM
jgi:hypothetical protein